MTIELYSPKGIAGVGMSTRGIDGIITVRAWPDFICEHDTDEWSKWRAALSPREWDRYALPLVVDGHEQDYAHNLLTTDGITWVLNNISFAAQASLHPIAQILSVGNGTIAVVARADTAVAGDAFVASARKVPGTPVVTGNQVDIPTAFLAADAQGTWTNIGFYGWDGAANATTTAGSGKLKTHSLFQFVKGAAAVTIDYLFVLNN